MYPLDLKKTPTKSPSRSTRTAISTDFGNRRSDIINKVNFRPAWAEIFIFCICDLQSVSFVI